MYCISGRRILRRRCADGKYPVLLVFTVMKKENLIRKIAYRIIPERAFWPVAGVVATHFAVYYIPKMITEDLPHYSLLTYPDTLIPFVPAFVVFYVLAFLQWGAYYVILAREEECVMRRFLTASFISKLICLVMFILVPSEITRPDASGPGVFRFCCRVVYSFDVPTNVFPSMHCLESWLCMRLALEQHARGRVPEVVRSLVRGYSGEMILCIDTKDWKEKREAFIRLDKKEIESVLEKIFSRRKYRLEKRVAMAADDVAEIAEEGGRTFIRQHTILNLLLSILVVMSTVFIKQHFFVDVISGILTAEISLFAAKLITGKKRRP